MKPEFKCVIRGGRLFTDREWQLIWRNFLVMVSNNNWLDLYEPQEGSA